MMRRFVVASAIVAALSSTAQASDCSRIKIMENQRTYIFASQLGLLFSGNQMDCVDMSKLAVRSNPGICAASVVDGYTIFESCGDGFNTMIAVKGTGYSEYQLLPAVEYRYLGPETFTKANGFSVQIPVIAPK